MEEQHLHITLQQNKVDLLHRLQLLTLIILIISTNISLFFSVWELPRKIFTSLILTSFLTVFLILSLIVKKTVKNIKFLNAFYFIFSISLMGVLVLISYDKGIVLVMSFVAPLLMMIFINYQQRYLFIFSSLLFMVNGCFLIIAPHRQLEIGAGYYVVNFSTLIIATYIGIKGIQMFKNYEVLLHQEIRTIHDQNASLTAYNEELIATEEEIRHQYNEIQHLNKDNAKLLEQLNAVFDASEDGIIDIDKTLNKTTCSHRVKILLNESFASLADPLAFFQKHLSETDFEALQLLWEDLNSYVNRTYSTELNYILPQFTKRLHLNLISYKSSQDQSEHIVIVIKDISESYYQSQAIYKMAYQDQLTNLMNRSAFTNYLEKVLLKRNTLPYALYIVDIDNFKYINDNFGFDFGDRLLSDLATRLTTANHPLVKAIARIGGDDFALLCTSDFTGPHFTDWFQSTFNLFRIDDIELKIHYSIGYIAQINSTMSPNFLLKNAEIAMYKAKERGKKGYFEYSDVLQNEIRHRLDLINELENALELGELSLNFQPKVNTHTQLIVGFEALIRWHSPKLGWVSPLDFITLAEQTGMIHQIGDFVIEESCIFAQLINAMNLSDTPLRVSINVSAVQLLNKDFYESFMYHLTAHAIPPHFIGIEITETVVMENKNYVSEQLQMFRQSGIHIYLDDFGTGYSSLNYLTQLPIDILKIDKTFVDHIHLKSREYEVVQMIIALAAVFNMETVAEGVETKEQYEILKEMGCKMIQGYYFSKPLKSADALILLGTPLSSTK